MRIGDGRDSGRVSRAADGHYVGGSRGVHGILHRAAGVQRQDAGERSLWILAAGAREGDRNCVCAMEIVVAGIGAQLDVRSDLPRSLQLAAIGDLLPDSLPVHGGAGDLRERQFESDQRDSL